MKFTDIVRILRAPIEYPNGMLSSGTVQRIMGEGADEIERLRGALESIANNTCCEGCQEAAKVARAALDHGLPTAHDVLGILRPEQ